MEQVDKETLQRLEVELVAMIEKEKKERIIPFLKGLSVSEKRALVPKVKKLYKYYSEIIALKKNSWGMRWTPEQGYILVRAGYVLFTYQELNQVTWSINSDLVEAICDWYIPSWLSECINRQVEGRGLRINGLNYQMLMAWIAKGWMNREPEPHLIAQLLAQSITVAEVFEEHDVTLREHVWHLFRYDCAQNWQDSKKSYFNFTCFIGQGKLDRMQVMKEALNATNRNFNKNLCGWFVGLFEALAPAEEELVVLQPELLSVLNCPQSRPVNVALSALKKLALHADFCVNDFLAQTPILFASEVKSVHQTTLAILLLLAKKNETHRDTICCCVAPALMSRDESTQSKVVKLIAGYGDTESSSLREALTMYEEAMLAATRKKLVTYLSGSDASSSNVETSESFVSSSKASCEMNLLPPLPPVLCEENRIPEIFSGDDFLFLASQVLHCNKYYHFDLFINELLRWDAQLTGAYISQLMPVFQHAYKMVNELPNTGDLDTMLAVFLIEYGLLLEKRFPADAEPLRKLYAKYITADKERKGQAWRSPLYENYQAHKTLLCYVLEQLERGVALPLLSTPTHIPAWIAPSMLIQRLQKYADVGIAPNDMDMQIALSRVVLQASPDDLKIVEDGLQGEYRALLLFFLGAGDVAPQSPFTHPSWWMTAGFIKSSETTYPEFTNFAYNKGHRNFLTGSFVWKNYLIPYSYTEYSSGKVITGNHSMLELEIPQGKNVKVENTSGYFMHLHYKYLSANPLLIETFWQLKSGWETRNLSLSRLIWLSPNLPEPILSWVILHCMSSPRISEVTEVTAIGTMMEEFYHLHHPWQEMSYLFATGCLLVHDKSTRAYAAELWVERVSYSLIDNERMGRILGRLLGGMWAPMKWFNDLIMSKLLNISTLHNRELECLLTALIAGLPENPVRDLKKLLEIYSEVLALNGSTVTDKCLLGTLNGWMFSPGLKKVLKTILNY